MLKSVKMNLLLNLGKSFNNNITCKCKSFLKLNTHKLIRRKKIFVESQRNPLYMQVCHFGSQKTLGIGSSLKTHSCGELCAKDVGTEVTLRGFLQYQRMGKFCVLRDFFGLTQILINDENISSILRETSFESYVEVTGEVKLRPNDQINTAMSTGEVEVHATNLNVLNYCKKEIPFLIRKNNMPTELLAMKYRYLDLRHQHLQENLRFRSKLGKKMRDYLQDVAGFIEITTPSLSVHTPGGAKEFVVPSRFEQKFYSLVQSPQMFKQLAIVGGFEKYFQFAICYRDEGGKPDRQPEFMQLDLELADTTVSDIENLMETLIVKSWPEDYPCLSTPFPSLSYDEAMDNYGTDKPDTRFDWKLSDVTQILLESDANLFMNNLKGKTAVAKAFIIPKEGGKYIKPSIQKKWDEITKNEVGLPGVILLHVKENNLLKGPAAKALTQSLSDKLTNHLNAQSGDVIVMSLGQKSKVLKILGKLRLLGADILEKEGLKIRAENSNNFLWVKEFPLFELSEETDKLISCHHPFTAPHPDQVQLLYENPLQVKSQHYDLVLNGSEIAGGSIRIHNPDLQRDVLNILDIDPTKLNFLLEALSYGAPPHGGIALGFDRYVSILRGCTSVRDVMAFPKTSEGKCAMSGAPENTTPENKKIYHLS